MTDEAQIRQVFQDFEDGGLVSKDIEKVLSCISDQIIGIGIGEQGLVHSREEIRPIFESGLREEDHAVYSLTYDHLDILIHDGRFANACGEISIRREENGTITRSKLLQTLVFIKENGAWRICGLHASAPLITEEDMEAYPLKVAENLLRSMRQEIGEKAYLAEEQFQQAVLADTIAFYIVNFSRNCFEKCQVNQELCASVEPGTPYEQFLWDNIPNYVADADRKVFMEALSLEHIWKAIAQGKEEITCEYLLRRPDGKELWAITVIRLITDCVTGEQKGIMYVKDIDRQKRLELEMKSRAERNDMTGLYNKNAFVRQVEQQLSQTTGPSVFLMLDLDNFKEINDTFGHPFGDRVLIAAAEILRQHLGEHSILGRLGGDEFAGFLSGVTAQVLAETCAENILEAFRRIETPGGDLFQITCSIGISSAQSAGTFTQLYQQADQALYQSKRGGKNCVTVL